MGEPAEVSAADRAETLAVARQWLDAVREDRPVRVDIRAIYGDINGFVTALCQEVTLLAEQLAEVRDARDMACHLILDALDPELNSDKKKMREHVAALRKVGAL